MGELSTSDASFGRVLAEQRKRRGLSRSELAEISELSYPYVSQLETGLRKPSRKAAAQLARALGMSVPELESVIPADESDEMELQRATMNAVSFLSSRGPTNAFGADLGVPTGPPSSPQDDLVGHIVDLLEDLDPDQRVEALAEVQKLMIRRMTGRG